jgi:D-methionine transport system permease protein
MGTPPLEILLYVLLPEALPALIEGATLMLINLVGYSAMAGAIGGGGLGDLAIRYGFHRSDEVVLAISVLLLLLLVQGIQCLGDFFENRERNRRQFGGNHI